MRKHLTDVNVWVLVFPDPQRTGANDVGKRMTGALRLSHLPVAGRPLTRFVSSGSRSHFRLHSVQSVRASGFAKVEAQRCNWFERSEGSNLFGHRQTRAQSLFLAVVNHCTQDCSHRVFVRVLRATERFTSFDLLSGHVIGLHFSFAFDRNNSSVLDAKAFLFQNLCRSLWHLRWDKYRFEWNQILMWCVVHW